MQQETTIAASHAEKVTPTALEFSSDTRCLAALLMACAGQDSAAEGNEDVDAMVEVQGSVKVADLLTCPGNCKSMCLTVCQLTLLTTSA